MATNVGTPSIPFNGLIFQLDIGSHKCVPNTTDDLTAGINSLINQYTLEGAQNTHPTQIGLGDNDADPTLMPTFNPDFGGYLDFTGGRGMNVNEDLGTGGIFTALTYSIWVHWPQDFTNNQYFFDARNNSGVWFFPNYLSYNINWNNNLQYNFGGGAEGAFNADAWPDEWVHIVAISDHATSNTRIYVNGSNRTADAATNTLANRNLGKNFRIGTRFTDVNRFRGKMGPVHIYNSALTDQEIMQLFNAYKGRFDAQSYEDLAAQEGW